MEGDWLPLLGVHEDGRDDSASDSSSDDNDVPPARNVPNPSPRVRGKDQPNTFDQTLPGAHSYLGNDLDDLAAGRTVHADGSYQTIPLVTMPGVVLIPGQTIPLHVFQQNFVSMLLHVAGKDKTFGLVTMRYKESGPSLSNFGTTAEIFSMKEERDDSSAMSTVRIKAIGRQRFSICDLHRQIDGMYQAKVKILPEKEVGDPLAGFYPTRAECIRHAYLQNLPGRNVQKKCRMQKYSGAYYTAMPPWVYKLYDEHAIKKRVKTELVSWNDSLAKQHVPSTASELSYWVAGNLPLDDGLKLYLLKLDNPLQRLRCELSIMQKCTDLCCSSCGVKITSKREVFSMAIEGPLAAYVNPGGHVHETLTVYKAQALTLHGSASTENSWFPGYAWTIANCSQCGTHMGWKFTVAKGKLKPAKFWGLTRSGLLPGLDDGDAETSHHWKPQI